jgi:signal transduction histidine kinase
VAGRVRVLLVEDSELDAELLLLELRRQGFRPEVVRVDTAGDLVSALTTGGWDVVVSDHNMPGFDGTEALRLVKQLAPDLPFIVVSGSMGEEHAVEAMRAGANDFVVKERLHRLAPAVERELREAGKREEQRRVAAALAESENRLRQAQKLEAVGRLAGGVAHDFNNLLTAILGYADLVLAQMAEEDPVRPDIVEIRSAGARAVDLTRQLLALSRRQVLRQTVLDLNAVIADLARLLGRVIGEDVNLETAFEPGLWPVKVDQTQIEQIVMNLAVNARDAMRQGGILTLGTANMAVTSANQADRPPKAGEYVMLTVRDTGDGIAPEVLPQIFEPFFTTKEAGRGTGLGLATVAGIVEQCDGHVFVTSELGAGTTFAVYLPRTHELFRAEEEPDSEPGPEIAATVLLVEDDTSVRELAARVLSQAGYRVLSADGPDAALSLVSRTPEPAAVLLTDVVMPGMNGPALADRVLAQWPDIRPVFMSGFTGEALTRAGQSPATDVLAKPFTPEQLVQRIRQALSSGV